MPGGRDVSPFVHIRELARLEDVRALLADPATHWREGFSAYELATGWMSAWRVARDLPAPVRRVLDGCPAYRGAALTEACFERRVDLGTPGRASQTDLMLKMRLPDGLAVIAVEGKADESLGQQVDRWNTTAGRDLRLTVLGERLGLPRREAGGLRSQRRHRTASALFEAARYAARHAMMLVTPSAAPKPPSRTSAGSPPPWRWRARVGTGSRSCARWAASSSASPG